MFLIFYLCFCLPNSTGEIASNISLWFITPVQLGAKICHAGMLCLFCFPNDRDRFAFVDINETHTLDKHDKIVLFLAIIY